MLRPTVGRNASLLPRTCGSKCGSFGLSIAPRSKNTTSGITPARPGPRNSLTSHLMRPGESTPGGQRGISRGQALEGGVTQGQAQGTSLPASRNYTSTTARRGKFFLSGWNRTSRESDPVESLSYVGGFGHSISPDPRRSLGALLACIVTASANQTGSDRQDDSFGDGFFSFSARFSRGTQGRVGPARQVKGVLFVGEPREKTTSLYRFVSWGDRKPEGSR